jgi:hypothetical protein
MNRRHLLMAAAAPALPLVAAQAAVPAPARLLSAREFGAAGDGRADDSAALQSVLDAAFHSDKPGMVVLPPGDYRVTRPLRVVLDRKAWGNFTVQCGISAAGARLISEIAGDASVIEVECHTTARFFTVAGLQIKGNGRERHGLSVDCNREGSYVYNFCLRDVVVEGCGGDGVRLFGNVFEGQVINTYCRDNKGNGATFGHGDRGGVLSSVHVIASVFGGNRRHGAAMVNRAADVGFHGCYFVENGEFGLHAPQGCTLLSHCGFENNHMAAADFASGDAGIFLQVSGTLVGCTAYSIRKQTHLVRAFASNQIVLVGCTGYGGGPAREAKLARIHGRSEAQITFVGCLGGIDREGGPDPVEVGQNGVGLRVGGQWDSGSLLTLGDHRLWVDRRGQLRIKRGRPAHDQDGAAVGTA